MDHSQRIRPVRQQQVALIQDATRTTPKYNAHFIDHRVERAGNLFRHLMLDVSSHWVTPGRRQALRNRQAGCADAAEAQRSREQPAQRRPTGARRGLVCSTAIGRAGARSPSGPRGGHHHRSRGRRVCQATGVKRSRGIATGSNMADRPLATVRRGTTGRQRLQVREECPKPLHLKQRVRKGHRAAT